MKTNQLLSTLLIALMASFTSFGSVHAIQTIFTTEGDYTNIDTDGDGDSNFSLYFGTNLGNEIEFDVGNDRFNISNDIQVTGDVTATGNVNGVNGDFTGTLDIDGVSTFNDNIDLTNNQALNFRVENAATIAGGACTAAALGRIYYDTTTEDLLFCKETAPASGVFVWATFLTGGGDTTVTDFPALEGFSFFADGSNNRGTLQLQYDDTLDRSFYTWSTRQGTAQDYTMVFQYQVPDNFGSFDGTNDVVIDYRTTGANSLVDMDIELNGTSAVVSAGLTSATFTGEAFDLSSAGVSAGDTLTFKVTMTGQSGGSTADLSTVAISYTES